MLYEALDKKTAKLVILESPTGTGKTYSLLVPLIVWLKKNPTNINTFPSN
jgi:Rad3-related DNA helicase